MYWGHFPYACSTSMRSLSLPVSDRVPLIRRRRRVANSTTISPTGWCTVRCWRGALGGQGLRIEVGRRGDVEESWRAGERGCPQGGVGGAGGCSPGGPRLPEH